MNAKICDCGGKKSAEFLCVCLAKDKGRKDLKKAYLHGEHLLVICRPLAIWTGEEEVERTEEKSGRGRKIRLEGMKEGAREKETMRPSEAPNQTLSQIICALTV